MSKNLKLVLEYDGTDFVGWQRQNNGRSVQEVIEQTILNITGEKIAIVGAGRTDSGVHARGQVANFHTESLLTPADFYRALNGILPDDIVVHSVEDVDDAFSARYSAREREYSYWISRVPTALERKYCWRVRYDLNLEQMNDVCRQIIGIHDFQSFCKADSSVEHYRCEVFHAAWSDNGKNIVFTIRANRFLHGMVRAFVGTMVDIGRGFTPVEEFQKILIAKDRSKAGQAAPPQGLFLERVVY